MLGLGPQKFTMHLLDIGVLLGWGILSYIVTFPGMAIAQESSLVCFMVQSSGELVDLTKLCQRQNQQNLGSQRQAQLIYQQAANSARQGLLEETINSLTQVTNLDPNLPEVYVDRANLRVVQQDPKGAIVDLQKAAELYSTKGDLEGEASARQQIEAIQQEFKSLMR